MIKQYYFTRVFIIIVLALFISPVAYAVSSHIDFHSFNASAGEVTKELPVILTLIDPEVEYIEVSLRGELAEADGDLTLAGNRLQLQTKREAYRISSEPSKVNVQEGQVDSADSSGVILNLLYIVHPEDLPGKYQGDLILKQVKPTGESEETTLTMNITVEPWLRMEVNSEKHLLARPGPREKSVISDFPGAIKIFSNVPWKLYTKSEKNSLNTTGKLDLNVFRHKDSQYELLEDEISLQEKEIALASGGPTVFLAEGYAEIAFALEVEDYDRIKAGRVDFPLMFRVESLK